MNLEEANARLKKCSISEEQLWQLNSIYILLDFHKDDFCKLIDAIGFDKWLEKQDHYERLDRAEKELSMKEHYLSSKRRLDELKVEQENLEYIINHYNPLQ